MAASADGLVSVGWLVGRADVDQSSSLGTTAGHGREVLQTRAGGVNANRKAAGWLSAIDDTLLVLNRMQQEAPGLVEVLPPARLPMGIGAMRSMRDTLSRVHWTRSAMVSLSLPAGGGDLEGQPVLIDWALFCEIQESFVEVSALWVERCVLEVHPTPIVE